MSSDQISIRAEGLSKRYEIYAQPADRLKQMVLPRIQRVVHAQPRAYFNEFWALRDVDFEVRRGETMGIVGRNGSGKSTLLQMICGTLAPTVGRVDVQGRIAALLELGAGFNPEFTGKENVRLSGLLYGLSEDELRDRYQTILEFADIGEFIDQPVKTYSSGMYVRLAFSVAINASPDVLIIDEALSVGDEAFQRKCFARIQKIKEAGATVLFVSHAAGTVIELCDRAILLDRGEMLAFGAPKAVVSRYHKLLYAPADQYGPMRDQFRRELRGADGGTPADVSALLNTASRQAQGACTSRMPEDYLDEGMVPKSMVRYANRGARIDQVHIESQDGRRVNVLLSCDTYVYCYRVRFDRPAFRVRYGMMIKTVTGIELGGAASHTRVAADGDCPEGATALVRFSFHCMLAPGVYFLNAGVLGEVDGQEQFLDRYLDVAMFRVLPDPDRLVTGTIDFAISPDVTLQNAVAS